jgi:transglutaminase-like putative cysteine protease
MKEITGILVCCALTVNCRSQLTAEELMSRYKDENAVVSSTVEHLQIEFEQGELKARSTISTETLMLTDLAPGLYGTTSVYHGSFNKLKEIEGFTVLPTSRGSKKIKAKEFKTVKSTASGVFYDDGHETKVTFTGLVKAARTNISYEIEHTDMHFLPSYYFESYVPIASATYKVTFPKSVNLRWQLRGLDTERIHMTKEEARHTTTYTWTAENLPRFRTFDNAPNASYYMPQVLVFIAEYKSPRDDEEKKLFGTVGDLYRFYYGFIEDLDKKGNQEILELTKRVTAGAVSERDKASRIYEYVQQNIKYVAFEDGMAGFIPRDALLVCNRKYGDCKDMANLLVAMSREAGLHAYHTWIGTRSKPYKYEETPLPVADNHMICAVRIGDEWIFMDGTAALLPFGVPPYSIQGKEALIGIDKNTYKVIKVPETAPEQTQIVDSTTIELQNRSIVGSVNINMKGYSAWGLQELMQYRGEKEKDDAIKSLASRGSNKYVQKSFDFKAADTKAKDVLTTSTFEVSDYPQKVGNDWYVNMNLQRSNENLWIDNKRGKIPVEQDFKYKVRQVVILNIPKGYHVSYLPPSIEKSAENLWGFKINYKTSLGKVHLIKEFEMNTLYIYPGQFEANNKIVQELRKQYKESVVLTAD